MNSKTFLEVAKGDTTEEENDKEEVEKCGGGVRSKMAAKAEESDLVREPSNKSEMLGRLDAVEKSGADIGERLGKIESTLSQLVESDKKVHDTMEKSEDETLTEKEEKKEETVEKAAPVEVVEEVKPDFIVKATMESEIKKAVDDVKKAYDEKFAVIEKAYTELKTTVESMSKQTIEKGGHVVIIEKGKVDANSKLGQLDLIGEVA